MIFLKYKASIRNINLKDTYIFNVNPLTMLSHSRPKSQSCGKKKKKNRSIAFRNEINSAVLKNS